MSYFKNCFTRSPKSSRGARCTSLTINSPDSRSSDISILSSLFYSPPPPAGSPLNKFAASAFNFNPFEGRLIIATAQQYELTLLSQDKRIQSYDVKI
jgi:hypothetical protein